MIQNPLRVNPRKKIRQVEYSPTLAINDEVQRFRLDGVEVLHMGFGQSPFSVHPIVQLALRDNAGANAYLPSGGLEELRTSARDYYAEKLGLDPGDYSVTECKLLMLKHAFENPGCVRVQFKSDTRNLRSQRALERIGAV